MNLDFVRVARELSIEAGECILELGKSPIIRDRKADHSLVTNADHAADKILRGGLHKAFPNHSILTEESGLEGPVNAEYLWVVDPLDGTRAYAKGITGYSVMVGLLKEGKPYAGIVFDPLEGHLYEAVRGGGTTHSFQNKRQQVHVSTRDSLDQMPVITSTGFPEAIEKSLRTHLRGAWVPAVNSVGVKIGYLARQVADIYINHHQVHYWDTCAPQIILEEAGGKITFLDGRPLTYELTSSAYRHTAPTLATNGFCHPEILAILRSVTPPLS